MRRILSGVVGFVVYYTWFGVMLLYACVLTAWTKVLSIAKLSDKQ